MGGLGHEGQQQRRQEGEAPSAVRKDVKKLHAHAAAVVQHAEGLRVPRRDVHGRAGQLRLRLHGKAALDPVYVVPEHAALYLRGKKRKAGHGEVQRQLEQRRLHGRIQIG